MKTVRKTGHNGVYICSGAALISFIYPEAVSRIDSVRVLEEREYWPYGEVDQKAGMLGLGVTVHWWMF